MSMPTVCSSVKEHTFIKESTFINVELLELAFHFSDTVSNTGL